jgi:hypothetical protein
MGEIGLGAIGRLFGAPTKLTDRRGIFGCIDVHRYITGTGLNSSTHTQRIPIRRF